MRIESILRRKDGTKVTLDGVEYHFKPDSDGREFADVTNEDHIGVFLAIREGYRLASASAKPAPQTILEATTVPAPAQASADELKKLDRAALSELYQALYGHRPASRLREDKIIEAIKAATPNH